jgi:hypothetical protein
MIRTQIQLPDQLYRQLKNLARIQETSLAELLRRAGEREVSTHPEIDSAQRNWEPPTPMAVGIREEIAVADWRMVANDPELHVPKRRRS